MMNKLNNTNNITTGPDNSEQGFYGLGVSPKILSILDRIKFKVPTPIQKKTIPLGLEGKDIMGIAQTGTGKTHSFAIPIVQRLVQMKGMALVLAPTRELAIQIDEAFKHLAHPFGIKTACLIGGASMYNQVQALRKIPRIITATPGRLSDHARQRNIMLNHVAILVLDEADRMLDMGFAPQIEQILRFVPKERQTMLFSASMPKEIMDMTARYMKLPVCVEIAPSGTAAKDITQELFIVKKEDRIRLLDKLLKKHGGAVLIFSRTKHNTRKLARDIRDMGYRAAEIHSDRSLSQRREALEGFKSGRYRILVATDIAARGIDVIGIELVVNFDLPEDAQNYIHRIGRTGRAGHKGYAVSFAMPDQSRDVRDIEKLIRVSLPIAQHPDIPAEQFTQYSHKASFRPHGRPFNRRRFGGHGSRRPHR